MADNLGPMAWLLLPENEQVQYLQKIALRAENPSGPIYFPRSAHFEKSKTKADNNISGRIAQNYRKIKSKNYKKNGTECFDFGRTSFENF